MRPAYCSASMSRCCWTRRPSRMWPSRPRVLRICRSLPSSRVASPARATLRSVIRSAPRTSRACPSAKATAICSSWCRVCSTPKTPCSVPLPVARASTTSTASTAWTCRCPCSATSRPTPRPTTWRTCRWSAAASRPSASTALAVSRSTRLRSRAPTSSRGRSNTRFSRRAWSPRCAVSPSIRSTRAGSMPVSVGRSSRTRCFSTLRTTVRKSPAITRPRPTARSKITRASATNTSASSPGRRRKTCCSTSACALPSARVTARASVRSMPIRSPRASAPSRAS